MTLSCGVATLRSSIFVFFLCLSLRSFHFATIERVSCLSKMRCYSNKTPMETIVCVCVIPSAAMKFIGPIKWKRWLGKHTSHSQYKPHTTEFSWSEFKLIPLNWWNEFLDTRTRKRGFANCAIILHVCASCNWFWTFPGCVCYWNNLTRYRSPHLSRSLSCALAIWSTYWNARRYTCLIQICNVIFVCIFHYLAPHRIPGRKNTRNGLAVSITMDRIKHIHIIVENMYIVFCVNSNAETWYFVCLGHRVFWLVSFYFFPRSALGSLIRLYIFAILVPFRNQATNHSHPQINVATRKYNVGNKIKYPCTNCVYAYTRRLSRSVSCFPSQLWLRRTTDTIKRLFTRKTQKNWREDSHWQK